jgi:hypothetical protein
LASLEWGISILGSVEKGGVFTAPFSQARGSGSSLALLMPA